MFRHILIPTDGSPLAKEASKAGVRLAAQLGAQVTGFFAAPPATPLRPEGSIRKAAQAYLGAIEKAARAAKVRCEVLSVTSDFPADAIIAAAKKCRCDLIFMASHGRRGLRSASYLGSETQKALSRSPVSVLVYRARR